MNKSTLIYIVILLSVFCSGCATSKMIATSQSDSTIVQIIERVVEVRDTVEVEIPKIVESITVMQDSSYLCNDYAQSSAAILPDGGLFHSLETIPQQIKSLVKVEVRVKDSIVYRNKEVINTVEIERELTAWQQWRLNGFWVLLAMVIVMIYFKIKP